MTVKEFCEKYKISHQAVYAKIRKKKNLLDGHIFKDGCLVLDSFAEEALKPVSTDGRFFKESEILKTEFAKKSQDFESLQDELYFKNEKIYNLEKTLTAKISENEILQKQLAEQNLKNTDLIKSVERLSEEVAEKSKIIDKLQNDISEQFNQKPKKLFGKS